MVNRIYQIQECTKRLGWGAAMPGPLCQDSTRPAQVRLKKAVIHLPIFAPQIEHEAAMGKVGIVAGLPSWQAATVGGLAKDLQDGLRPVEYAEGRVSPDSDAIGDVQEIALIPKGVVRAS